VQEAVHDSYQEEDHREADCELEEAALESSARAVDRLRLAAEDTTHACTLALHQYDEDEHNRQYELNNVKSVLYLHRIVLLAA
jgi:hypothetical protein